LDEKITGVAGYLNRWEAYNYGWARAILSLSIMLYQSIGLLSSAAGFYLPGEKVRLATFLALRGSLLVANSTHRMMASIIPPGNAGEC
jgi:hypothetical protein